VVVNNLMLYGTGGLAWAQTKFSYRDEDSTTPNITIKDTKIGLVGGAGAEWNVAGNLLLRAEWLHYAFGRDDLIPNAFPPQESSIANRFSSVDVIRVGLDYRFGDRREAPLK
jgi:opacity protein-like surface antigen